MEITKELLEKKIEDFEHDILVVKEQIRAARDNLGQLEALEIRLVGGRLALGELLKGLLPHEASKLEIVK
jgi:hypothetical protein